MANRQSGPQDLSIGDIICQEIYLPTPSLPSLYPPLAGEAQEPGSLSPCFLMAHVGLTSWMTGSPFRHLSAWVQSLLDRILQVFGDTPFCTRRPRLSRRETTTALNQTSFLATTSHLDPLVFRVDLAIRQTPLLALVSPVHFSR
jgi:hypothetical protein